MWSTDRKRSNDLTLILGLNETIDQLAMEKSACWYSHVLWMADGHALRRALLFDVESQRKKWWPKRTWKMQVDDEDMKFDFSRDDVLFH